MNKLEKALLIITKYPTMYSLEERNAAIDIIEEFISKESPMKVKRVTVNSSTMVIDCGNCDNRLMVDIPRIATYGIEYCSKCGQKLDWEGVDR